MSLLKSIINEAPQSGGTQNDIKIAGDSDAGKYDVLDKAHQSGDVAFSAMRNTINSSGEVTGVDVARYINRAEELNDEVDTVPFGLETDTGEIVKVYVNATQADEFEEAMKNVLGLEDDIEEAINRLATKFDIIDVVWPRSDDGSGGEVPQPETPETDISDLPTDEEPAAQADPEGEFGDGFDASLEYFQTPPTGLDYGGGGGDGFANDSPNAAEREVEDESDAVGADKLDPEANEGDDSEEDEMEPVLDDDGNPVLDDDGNPKMKKKKKKKPKKKDGDADEAAAESETDGEEKPPTKSKQEESQMSIGNRFAKRQITLNENDESQLDLDAHQKSLESKLTRPMEKRIVELAAMLGVPGKFIDTAEGIEGIRAGADELRRGVSARHAFDKFYTTLAGEGEGDAKKEVEEERNQEEPEQELDEAELASNTAKLLAAVIIALGVPANIINGGPQAVHTAMQKAAVKVEQDKHLKTSLQALARRMKVAVADLADLGDDMELTPQAKARIEKERGPVEEDVDVGNDPFSEKAVELVHALGIPDDLLGLRRSQLVQALRANKRNLAGRNQIQMQMQRLIDLIARNKREEEVKED